MPLVESIQSRPATAPSNREVQPMIVAAAGALAVCVDVHAYGSRRGERPELVLKLGVVLLNENGVVHESGLPVAACRRKQL